MDSSLLEEEILDVFQEVTPEILDNEILSVDVTEDQQQDGSTEFSVSNIRGAVEVDENARRSMRPLARAIARAVVSHLETHGQVDLGNGRIS